MRFLAGFGEVLGSLGVALEEFFKVVFRSFLLVLHSFQSFWSYLDLDSGFGSFSSRLWR